MAIAIDTTVMLPGYAPYPRYGRVGKHLDGGQMQITNVQCGDPRCASEHAHADAVWSAAALEAANAYQPRAGWELGRKSSANAPGEG